MNALTAGGFIFPKTTYSQKKCNQMTIVSPSVNGYRPANKGRVSQEEKKRKQRHPQGQKNTNIDSVESVPLMRADGSDMRSKDVNRPRSWKLCSRLIMWSHPKSRAYQALNGGSWRMICYRYHSWMKKLKRQTPKRTLYLTTICPLHGMLLRNPFHQAEKTSQARGFWLCKSQNQGRQMESG